MSSIEQFKNCIRKYANKWAYANNLESDELFNQGVLTFYDCVETYDPEKGIAFITYLINALENNLARYSRNYYGNQTKSQEYEECRPSSREQMSRDPESYLMSKEMIESISNEAIIVVKVLFNELDLEPEDSNRAVKGKLRKHLREFYKWSDRRISKRFKEVSAAQKYIT